MKMRAKIVNKVEMKFILFSFVLQTLYVALSHLTDFLLAAVLCDSAPSH